MFDPNDVDRREGMTWDLSEHGGRECVLASDYDKLLELYREFVPAMPCYICGKEAKGSEARGADSKEPVCMNCWNAA